MKIQTSAIILTKNIKVEGGRILCAGTIYGHDHKGPFYCQDYRITGVNKNSWPIMYIYRYNDNTGHWFKAAEGNETTEKIFDLYCDNDEICTPSRAEMLYLNWRPRPEVHKDKTIMVKSATKPGFKYYGMTLTKGMLYGEDERGYFCMTKLPDLERVKFIGESPRLYIWRPIREDFIRQNNKHRAEWECKPEANRTTQRILEYYLDNIKRCKPNIKADAADIASSQDIYNPWYDITPYKSIHGQNTHDTKTSIEIVIGTKTLDELADEQRGIYLTNLHDD